MLKRLGGLKENEIKDLRNAVPETKGVKDVDRISLERRWYGLNRMSERGKWQPFSRKTASIRGWKGI